MDKAKKKRIQKIICWICLAALVLGLAVMPMMAKTEVEEDGPKATIHSGTVHTGSVSMALHGGGTLETEDAENVTLPSGVKITEFLVHNGDIVTEGTPLASVDKVSVMTAITEVTETLDYLREELEDARDETVDSTISATAGGRVKKVYAQPGDKVEDVMLRYGALAVLSLDSLMAVSIERNMAITTGESVCVTFSDGTEVDGRVESNLGGVIVVTVEDEGYAIGQSVTVTTHDGDRVGSGSLYVHNAWKATAFAGTVSTVSAKEETTVSAGSTLLTLKDTSFRGDQEYLAGQHREYEALLQDLFRMYEDGVITAPCDGVISGVDEDSEYLLAAIDGEQGWYVDLLSNETNDEKGWTVMLLSNEEEVLCTGKTGCEAEEHNPGCPEICLVGETCLATLHHDPGCIKLCNGTAECPSLVHYASCVALCANNADCTAISHRETCPWHTVTYSAYAGKVFAAGTTNLVLYMDSATKYDVTAQGSGWTLTDPGALNTDLMIAETVYPVADGSQFSAGDIVLIVSGVGTDGTVLYQDIVVHQKGQSMEIPGMGDFPGLDGLSGLGGLGSLAGLMGGMSGAYGGTVTQETVELFDLEGSVLMTVTPQDTAKLTITLDEQDIASVSLGQSADVKVEALRGQSFEAEITNISRTGTNSGGSSKFAVELTMDMGTDMLSGMSATASIPLYTKMDVLTIPVAALVENGADTVVYTALDEETGEPTAPVSVTIGISDGETAEVLSGLESGAKYYYSYYDVLELSTEVEAEAFSFGG